jgi:hypothetical protein
MSGCIGIDPSALLFPVAVMLLRTEFTPLLHPSNVNVKDLQTTLDAM